MITLPEYPAGLFPDAQSFGRQQTMVLNSSEPSFKCSFRREQSPLKPVTAVVGHNHTGYTSRQVPLKKTAYVWLFLVFRFLAYRFQISNQKVISVSPTAMSHSRRITVISWQVLRCFAPVIKRLLQKHSFWRKPVGCTGHPHLKRAAVPHAVAAIR